MTNIKIFAIHFCLNNQHLKMTRLLSTSNKNQKSTVNINLVNQILIMFTHRFTVTHFFGFVWKINTTYLSPISLETEKSSVYLQGIRERKY